MSDYGRVFFDLLGELMGQPYDDPRYFWGTPCVPRDSCAQRDHERAGPERSGIASQRRMHLRREALRSAAPFNPETVPAELTQVTEGCFTPFIGLSVAAYQVPRVARARGMTSEALHELIEEHAETASGEDRRVNVLSLNMALDDMDPTIGDNDPDRTEKAPPGVDERMIHAGSTSRS
jgi:potassium-transporting ATPase KdpC subunit